MAMPIPRCAHADLLEIRPVFGDSTDFEALFVSVSLVEGPGNLNDDAHAAIQNTGLRKLLPGPS
jgi:hypothetical protein